jgi:iron(III) transport system substrate-binding protein
MKNTVLSLIVLVLLLLAGVGGYFVGTLNTSTKTVTTTVQGPSDVSQTVADSCKAEGGAATFYSVVDTSDWPKMNAILTKEFPFMNVNFVGLAPQDEVTKANTEHQAGHVVADVFQNSLALLIQMKTKGDMQPYSDYLMTMDNYSSSFNDPDNVWHAFVVAPLTVMYNTNLVTDTSTLPKNWNDLTNPIWKGKIAMDKPATLNVAGLVFATLAPSFSSNATWTDFLKGIAANQPIYTASGGDAYSAVASGEAPLAIGFINDYLSGVGKSPVKPITFNPTITLVGAVGLAANGPHPWCGRLLLQWLESYSGQKALSLTGRGPAHPSLTTQFYTGVYPPGNQFLVGATGEPSYFTDSSGWAGYYTSIFGS